MDASLLSFPGLLDPGLEFPAEFDVIAGLLLIGAGKLLRYERVDDDSFPDRLQDGHFSTTSEPANC
jgi:hypothetical protein